ncbi:hypothetical protein IAU60_004775 [Kwoniella sp. DSM 27419]
MSCRIHLFVSLLACLVLVLGQNSTAPGSSDLRFGPVNFASYNNYVYRDNTTSAQIVISDSASTSAPSRFILAFPRGNTGALVYFVPLNQSSNATTSSSSGDSTNSTSSGLGATLDLGSVTSVTQDNNQTGLTGTLSVSADLEFGVTLIGSVRTLRDYVESGGKVFNSIFNYTLIYSSNSSVVLQRKWINGTTAQFLTFESVNNALINVVPNSNVSIPPGITVTRPDQSSNATLRFTHVFNFTGTTPETPYVPLVGVGPDQLFLTTPPDNSTPALGQVLNALQGNGTEIVEQVSFLSYTTEALAGGWRFLTYFGRDTLLALRLLLPVISETSAEAILGAVLQRINETGTICHEETVGDYASFVHIQNNQSELGNTPSYSYVMVDTDFLLLPVLAEYLLNSPQGSGRATSFLSRNSTLKSGTFNDLLIKNVDHVLNLTRPFAEDAISDNLVRIRDPLVGDWRDSGTGLGYGVFPFDVNCALVPGALRAIAQMASASLLPSNYSIASTYLDTWETSACGFFGVSIDSSTATSRLDNYVSAANLSQSLLYGAGSLNASTGNGSIEGWSQAVIGSSQGVINGTTTPVVTNGTMGMNGTSSTNGTSSSGKSTFYGLSINANGSVVEVLNSDLGFVLLYNDNVTESIITATIEALQPYPRGLLTNVGMVVSNAAYDSNTTNIETFNNLQYHGAVSWSWQQALMASGLTHQLALCSPSYANSTLLTSSPAANQTSPAWCDNPTLVAELQDAQTRLWYSIAGSASALYTEVLSPIFQESQGMFSIGDLGAISPTGTEGDAIQLWSYGFLAQVDPRTGRPVAEGLQ